MAPYLGMRPDITQLFSEAGGVIRRADHPVLARRLDRLRRQGLLDTPIPGVLWRPALAEDFQAKVLAGFLWAGPDAVLTGRAAARLTFWPDCPVERFSYAIPRRRTARAAAWSLGYRRIPAELIAECGRVRLTVPALTAVDLTAVDLAADAELGGEAIDRVLASRTGTLPQMWEAFLGQPNRPGNAVRQALLHDSRDLPWSEGERGLHRLLRRHRITGWQANARVLTRHGDYFADVLFRRQRLITEMDGFAFHSDRKSFEQDRRRRNALVLAGYRVLNFTWRQLADDPQWVLDCIRRGLTG